MVNLIEIGLSGWICTFVVIIIGGVGTALGYRRITRRKTKQTKIKAGRDVAGGDIIEKKIGAHNDVKSLIEINCVQKDITAKGNVAGGSIVREDK